MVCLTFLVIDDEQDVCDLFRVIFESRGHRCLHAVDGATGLALVRRERPSAVFLDIAMPNMNGYEVLAELKKDSETSKVPVLLMTALTKNTPLSSEEWAHSTGADAFLAKPFEIDELLEVVEKLTGVNLTASGV
jgi:twitching motility two-component system response regulator PilH